MAQTYVKNRVAYDLIGVDVFIVDKSTWTSTPVGSVDVSALNKISTDIISSGDRAKSVVIVFPEPLTLLASMIWTDGGGFYDVWHCQSSDILNENNWTLKAHVPCGVGTAAYAAFAGFQGAGAGLCKAVMFDQIGATNPSSGIGMIHLLGSRASSDRLEIFDTVDEELIEPISFGDVATGSTSDTTFRVSNLSESLTAYSVTVSVSDPHVTLSPSVASQFLISTDGGVSFAATGTISALGPTQASGEIILRRITSTDIPTGDHVVRINASAGSWL